MKSVKKRDNRVVEFDRSKIVSAIQRAFIEVDGSLSDSSTKIANTIADEIAVIPEDKSVEEIQDLVIYDLMDTDRKDVAKAYTEYRFKRSLVRDSHNTTDNAIMELLNHTNEEVNEENSNKDPEIVSVQRDYIAGITSKDVTRRILLPKEIVDAHDAGLIHFHDADYYAQSVLTNCSLCNLDDMLQNGTVINGTKIDKPHRFITAATISTQIITAVTSSQYGGISITLTHLAPFVRDSYNIYLKKYLSWGFDERKAAKFAELDTRKEVEDGCQTFIYQVNSMSTTNGQAPFLTVFMYIDETEEYRDELVMIIEEFLRQRIQGMKNEQGIWITPAFPKLIYVLDDDNIYPGTKYWSTTVLAAQCTAKRMVPDYISAKVMKQLKGYVYPAMGCRSFLTPYVDPVTQQPKFYGRFNCGVVTISLPDLAFSSGGDYDKFWQLFEERTELCHKALRCRIDRIKDSSVNVAPILWRHGAFARLPMDAKIGDIMFNGYSTISLGYAGLYECVKYMTGHSHMDKGVGREFGLKVMQALNDKCTKWKNEEHIDYSLYGTPIENTTYKFAKCLKKRFGDDIFIKMDGKDRNYITNSYHTAVFEKINPFDKLIQEAEFQKLSPGGAISYIECSDLTHNIPAVLEVMQCIYENIMYAELNIKSDYCSCCGYDGEIKVVDDGGKLVWECPNCGNRDQHKMSVARRTCGYVGTHFWSQGRTDEIRNRYVHLTDIPADGEEVEETK